MKERIRAILEEVVASVENRLDETGCLDEDDFDTLERATLILQKLEAVSESETIDAEVVDIGIKELRAAATRHKPREGES